MDAVCMALSGVSSLRWKGTASGERTDTAVMIMMLLIFWGKNYENSVIKLSDCTGHGYHAFSRQIAG